MTPDPIGLAGGLNPYSYAGNNPINYIDPMGLKSKRNWWELLEEGHYYGTTYGEEAVDYWAGKYNNSGNIGYAIAGSFAAAWTKDTYIGTASSLSAAKVIPGLYRYASPYIIRYSTKLMEISRPCLLKIDEISNYLFYKLFARGGSFDPTYVRGILNRWDKLRIGFNYYQYDNINKVGTEVFRIGGKFVPFNRYNGSGHIDLWSAKDGFLPFLQNLFK